MHRWSRSSRLPCFVGLFLSWAVTGILHAQPAITVDAEAADAVLSILAKNRRGEPLGEADWQRLLASDGYRRLGERETAMNRPFGEAMFREFVLSDELAARGR